MKEFYRWYWTARVYAVLLGLVEEKGQKTISTSVVQRLAKEAAWATRQEEDVFTAFMVMKGLTDSCEVITGEALQQLDTRLLLYDRLSFKQLRTITEEVTKPLEDELLCTPRRMSL